MERLNYFHPYKSKSDNHEDQLTRAYLVLLKYSFHSVISFYDYCRKVFEELTEQHLTVEKLPYLNDLISFDWLFETQKINPVITSEVLLSVLITDNFIEELQNKLLQTSSRNARYDGIITMGGEITFIIEVKPNSQNVWFDQLSPSRENLSEDTKVLTKPIVLQWKEIIKQLNALLNFPTIASQEKMMIHDFLEFIDEQFPFLNPYDSFELCKNNQGLIYRRIENLLKQIAKETSKVDIHRGWGNIIRIDENFADIYQIGLILVYNNENASWYLDLCFYFADTVSQARMFYKKDIHWKYLSENNWEIKPNLHLAFRSQGLVWFQSTDIQKYIDYWKTNAIQIKQYLRDEIEPELESLQKSDIITYDSGRKEVMKEKFFKTEMSKLNLCPGLGLIYKIDSLSAIKMDNEKKLVDFLKVKIIEAFSIVGYTAKDLESVLNI